MEFEYSTFRTRDGVFYRPTIDVTFRYRSKSFPYKAALVDTGSDFVMLPLSVAEALGAEPDLESVTVLDCACGGEFRSYVSRHPIEIVLDCEGFRTRSWQTHVRFVQAEVTVLLGHRGFLDRLDATFSGKHHMMKLSCQAAIKR